jgi:outer membrane biosynthesis protein TonB
MSFNNTQLHGFAFVGTLALAGVLFGGTLYLSETGDADHEPQLKELITIEASLARKSEKKVQPQKPVKPPEPEAKPEGVSHDENQKPVEPKPDDKKPVPKPADTKDPFKNYKHSSDDDQQTGTPTTDIGQFDGSREGFAQVNAGNPYWQHFVADFKQIWEIPVISKVNGATKACFHIEPDGKIADVKFEHSGDETLDASVQRAMTATKKARNDKPQPVPTEQLAVIKGWVCFRFTP